MSTTAQNPLNFQDLILKLHSFWASKGCLIWQPHNQVVGAGTMNPATFLRVLGPEPWNVAYVEPSARPDDGRFGQNPNRLYTHTQYQVILKPSPERSQDLYLESLAAVGIDYKKHDIRFVEDNWAQPAIGAWGLGWEVWIDGLEITQYTYFQQVGGVTLDPVPLELTYGLERIAMFLQGTRTVFDLKWDTVRTYGDVKLQDEIERSQYAFHHADVEELHELFDKYEKEGKRAVASGLVLPAHDYVLNMSNTFNLLDTRGAIGVTERARAMGRVRDLAQLVAVAYVAQREAMGQPWLRRDEGRGMRDEVRSAPPSSHIAAQKPTHPSSLLLEIGVEELPADDVPKAQAQLGRLIESELKSARLAHGAVQLFATPRRIAALVADVAPSQRPLDEWVKGPGAKVAFDASGNPTQAAIGFAKRSGVDVADLVAREEGGASYVYARKHEAGKPATEVLASILPSIISKLSFEKTMRWNATNVAFARPLQWFVALLGDSVIPFEYAGVSSGNASAGPRGEGSPEFTIDQASNYQSLLTNHHILADMSSRRAEIARQIESVATSVGGKVVHDEGLLEEVTNLVEQPTAVLGHIDAEYMAVPTPVLMTVMRKHQRYFSIVNGDGALLPHFIAVRNGNDQDTDLVRIGNEGVLRARFADANYFFKQDIQQPLESYVNKLSLLTFQSKLGSMLDKTKRIEQLVEPIASSLITHRASEAASSLITAKQVAHLCKADLVTSMVVDFTSLQGVMGREYLLKQGGDATVANAIAEHYLPRYAGDAVAKSEAGIIVALADKLDSLAGLFAVGLGPKGNADPFALRRAAIGVVQTLIENGKRFSLRQGLLAAMQLLPVKWDKAALDAAHGFIMDRAKVVLSELGLRYDVVDAVMAELGDDPSAAQANAVQLDGATKGEAWPAALAAYARCARITKGKDAIDASAISADDDPSVQTLAKAMRSLPAPNDARELVENLTVLVAPINTFFEKVMVMSDDAAQRNARIALLQQVAAQAIGIADLSKIEGF
jgi:glycyl-tRNA synthetase